MVIADAILTFGAAILTVLLFTSADEIGTTHPDGHRNREPALLAGRGRFAVLAAVVALIAWLVLALAIGAFHAPQSAFWMTLSAVLTAVIGGWLGYNRPVLRASEYR